MPHERVVVPEFEKLPKEIQDKISEQQVEKTTTFKFNELSDKAKDKAIRDNIEINIDYEWWEFTYEDFKRELAEIGISVDDKHSFYFDIDRGSFFALNKPSIDNEKLFLKFCEVELRTKRAKEIINETGIQIQTQHHSGSRMTHYVTSNGYNEETDLTECLNNKLGDFLSRLRSEYDYLISDKAIEETLISNDYDFTEDGEMI